MTVGELRKALDGVADDMPVATYREGWIEIEGVSAEIKMVALGGRRAGFDIIWEHSGHPPQTVGQPWFLIN